MLWIALTLSCRHAAPHSPSESSGDAAEAAVAPPDAAGWASLACALGRYTPRIVLDAAAPALYAEVAGSLRLFGGLSALLGALRRDLQDFPWTFNIAVASSARAAGWLARGGDGVLCVDQAQTRAALVRLPLSLLPLPAALAQRLTGFGLRSLGEVLALPRAALGARLGAGFVLDLARALGEVHDPMPWFEFPEHFSQALELPAPVEAAPVLLFAARRLVAALCGWLTVRNAALREMHWRIEHGRDHGQGVFTELPLRFSAPVHAAARIERVLKEALDRLPLPAPALGLHLDAAAPELRDARSQRLFGGADGVDGNGGDGGNAGNADAADKLAELLDRLQARLGSDAVRSLRCHADHRPEGASVEFQVRGLAKVGSGGTGRPSGRRWPEEATAIFQPDVATSRPLCLLDAPRRLSERGGRPWRGGPLRLLAGPERIESGWWDGDDVRRDYFVALDAQQCWLWIYRTCDTPAQWFLQGVFC